MIKIKFDDDKSFIIELLNNPVADYIQYSFKHLQHLDLDIAINNMYLEAQNLGLDITELNIDIKNGVLILNEKIEGVQNDK